MIGRVRQLRSTKVQSNGGRNRTVSIEQCFSFPTDNRALRIPFFALTYLGSISLILQKQYLRAGRTKLYICTYKATCFNVIHTKTPIHGGPYAVYIL